MRSNVLAALFALLCLSLALPRDAAALPSFPNGGFENGTTSDWYVYNPSGQPVTFGVTSTAGLVKTGTYAGQLSVFGGTTDPLRIYNQAALTGTSTGSLLHVTLQLRLNNVVFNNIGNYVSPLLVALDASGNVLRYGHVAGTFHGNFPYMKIEFLLEQPPNAVNLQTQIFLAGGLASGTVLIDDLSIAVLTEPGPASTTGLLDVQVNNDSGGTPRLEIGGVAEPPTFFMGASSGPVVFNEISKAALEGVRLIQLEFQLPWEGFSSGQMACALLCNGQALFMPRVNLNPPALWLSENPSIPLVKDHTGATRPYPSLASDAMVDKWKDQLTLLIKFLRKGDYINKVIGYHPAYLTGGEWFYDDVANYYWDYSETNRAKFQAWAQTKYGTIGALNTAWSKSLANFNAVTIPTTGEWAAGDDGWFRNPATRVWMSDYQTYFNDLVADRIAQLAAHVKSLTDDKNLFTTFYGYQFELINNSYQQSIGSSGHMSLRKLLTSPDVDIIASPVSYDDRQPGGPSNVMGPVDSITLAGKIQLQEDDSRTHLWTTPTPEPSLAYGTEYNTLNCLRRNFGNVLSHNLGIWWMDLQANGNYDSTTIWDYNGLMKDIYAASVTEELPNRPQVALIYDEDTPFWLKGNSFDLSSAYLKNRSIFQELGAQVGYYHVQDVGSLPSTVKMVVFVNCFRLTSAEKTAINGIKGSNRTLVWLYAPGYLNETAISLSDMSTLTGFTMQKLVGGGTTALTIANNFPMVTKDLTSHSFGTATTMTPRFAVNASDTAAITVGTYNSGGARALAIKEMGTWRSVYCGSPILSVNFARNLARAAGVNLQADSQIAATADVVQTNDRYVYLYARGSAGNRSIQLPGELIPNGSFERDNTAIPSDQYGKWSTLASGAMIPTVANSVGVGGSKALQVGTFSNGVNAYVVPVVLRLPNAKPGKTYNFSCKMYLSGLNAASANSGNYVYLQVSPAGYVGGVTQNFAIAEGTTIYKPQGSWFTLSGTYTHSAYSVADPYASVHLIVYGAYSATAIRMDDLTLYESDRIIPTSITDMLTNTTIATSATGWTTSFLANEQKIFRLNGTLY